MHPKHASPPSESPSKRRPKVERPTYSDMDIGVCSKLAELDKECKQAQDHYTSVKSRLAFLQAEEARVNVRLKKAACVQRALSEKRKVQELFEADRLRRQELDEKERREKAFMRNLERDRKEKARQKMEALFNTKRNEVEKFKSGWTRAKKAHESEQHEYQQMLLAQAKEDKETTLGRRQKLQDSLDSELLRRAESRMKEKKRNDELLKKRKETEEQVKSAWARQQREAAKGHSSRQFEDRVRQNKQALLAEVNLRVETKKNTAADIGKEIARLEQQESMIRKRLEERRMHLQETDPGGLASPLASITPRLLRSR